MGEDIKSDLAGIAITHPFFADMVTNALNYIEELEKENKELKEDNEQLDAIKNEAVRRYNFESIPKSKVKEKIEELKNGTYDAKIILQQLLEENTGNHIPRID